MHAHYEFPVPYEIYTHIHIVTGILLSCNDNKCCEGIVELLEGPGACESINSDYHSADSAFLVETLEEYLSERE